MANPQAKAICQMLWVIMAIPNLLKKRLFMFVSCKEKPLLDNKLFNLHSNDPINLLLIERISKSRERYNGDQEAFLSIRFYRNGEVIHQWMFEKSEESLRDEVFARLESLKLS